MTVHHSVAGGARLVLAAETRALGQTRTSYAKIQLCHRLQRTLLKKMSRELVHGVDIVLVLMGKNTVLAISMIPVAPLLAGGAYPRLATNMQIPLGLEKAFIAQRIPILSKMGATHYLGRNA